MPVLEFKDFRRGKRCAFRLKASLTLTDFGQNLALVSRPVTSFAAFTCARLPTKFSLALSEQNAEDYCLRRRGNAIVLGEF